MEEKIRAEVEAKFIADMEAKFRLEKEEESGGAKPAPQPDGSLSLAGGCDSGGVVE